MNFYTQQSANHLIIRYQLFFIMILVLISFFSALYIDIKVWHLVQKAISDAYIQVATFVAATLIIFYSLEKFFHFDLSKSIANRPYFEIVISSFLGALPGCGGAIMVITQYVRGKLSFGAVMATLTATMGDAAFLLIAKKPLIGLLILLVGFVVGVISGILVNKIHGPDFMRDKNSTSIEQAESKEYNNSKKLEYFWIILFIPGIFLGVFTAFQIDLNVYFTNIYIDELITLFGFLAGSLCFFMWLFPYLGGIKKTMSSPKETIIRRTVSDTNFVTGWVIIAFLVFELTVYFVDIDLKNIFSNIIYLVPLIAILIGFLPGCGPQLLVTTMYLAGYVPLSAQIGNAISNDGDALFPALVISPKVALVATLYSALPALIVSYGYLFIFEI
ncbi:MAG: arsenic efflux protein [Proteobacteria bacterium]|nr:arsenic efflux protein [Pseudomonadota bacterium]MDA1136702.1 arsenic efflux protein [Pseudomonadota bacterium]